MLDGHGRHRAGHWCRVLSRARAQSRRGAGRSLCLRRRVHRQDEDPGQNAGVLESRPADRQRRIRPRRHALRVRRWLVVSAITPSGFSRASPTITISWRSGPRAISVCRSLERQARSSDTSRSSTSTDARRTPSDRSCCARSRHAPAWSWSACGRATRSPRSTAGCDAAADRARSLLAINNAVVLNLTQDALFHAITTALRPVIPFDRMTIFLYDEQKNVLRMVVAESAVPSDHFVPDSSWRSTRATPAVSFINQRPFFNPDLAKDAHIPGRRSPLPRGLPIARRRAADRARQEHRHAEPGQRAADAIRPARG